MSILCIWLISIYDMKMCVCLWSFDSAISDRVTFWLKISICKACVRNSYIFHQILLKFCRVFFLHDDVHVFWNFGIWLSYSPFWLRISICKACVCSSSYSFNRIHLKYFWLTCNDMTICMCFWIFDSVIFDDLTALLDNCDQSTMILTCCRTWKCNECLTTLINIMEKTHTLIQNKPL